MKSAAVKEFEMNNPAARDTTFDNVKPERLWILIDNCEKDGQLRVSFELNGIKKEIFAIKPSYAEKSEGIISQSTNLSWIIGSALEAERARSQKLREAIETARVMFHKDDKDAAIKNLQEIFKELEAYSKSNGSKG